VITEAVSWHWIFFVNVPIGLLTVLLGIRLIEPDRGLGLRHGADVIGAVLVTAALMLGVYSIVESETYGLGSIRTLGLGGISLVLLAAFVIRQAMVATPLMPLRLFASRNFSGANVIQGLMVAAFFGFFFLGSLYLQRVLEYGPLQIGMAFMPNTVAMAALSIGLAARLITRFGAQRVLLAGLSGIGLGMLLFARSPIRAEYVADLLPGMILLGLGAGLAFTSLSMLAMNDVTPLDSGLASGLLNTSTQVAAALGLSILATISSEHARGLVAQGLDGSEALSAAYHLTWAISAGLVVVALVLAVTVLKRQPPRVQAPAAQQAASRASISVESGRRASRLANDTTEGGAVRSSST
jgi:MFS family permease